MSSYKNINIGNKIFNFNRVSQETVLGILKNTKTSTAAGLDNLFFF